MYFEQQAQSLCSIPEGKLIMTMCASNHALFIHANRKCSASCSMERRQVPLNLSFAHARTRAKNRCPH